MTRIAILSVAHMHAQSYCRALQSIQSVQISGVYDDDAPRAKRFAERNGLHPSTDLEDLLSSSDAAIICAENRHHLRYIEAAARAGKPVLCEKPLSSDRETGRRISEVIHSSQIPFYLALPMRFVSSVQEARAAVTSGAIGRVLAMQGTNHGSVPQGWFLDDALSGGGAVADHVPHVVDLMHWMIGKEVTEVYAEIDSGDFTSSIDDCAILTMTWADGTFSTLDPSWSRIQGVYPEWGDVTLEVVGTQGVVSVDALAQKVDSFTQSTPNHRHISYGDDADFYMIHEFVSCVRQGTPSKVLATLSDGMHALRVTHAAYESAKTGQPVTVSRDY